MSSKLLDTAVKTTKSTIEKAISNGMAFSVQVLPFENSNGVFPADELVYRWLDKFLCEELEPNVLNEKALAGMRKHWEKTHPDCEPFVLKKQPSDIIVILIAPSDSSVYVGYSLPASSGCPYISENIISITHLSGRDVYLRKVTPPEDSSVFKHKDKIFTDIMNSLKQKGIYVDDEEDEAVINYLATD
jgi:hypothetical protein